MSDFMSKIREEERSKREKIYNITDILIDSVMNERDGSIKQKVFNAIRLMEKDGYIVIK